MIALSQSSSDTIWNVCNGGSGSGVIVISLSLSCLRMKTDRSMDRFMS